MADDGRRPGGASWGGGPPADGPPSGPLRGQHPPERPRRSRWRPLVLVVIGVLVLATGIAGLLVGTRKDGGGGAATGSSAQPDSAGATAPTRTGRPTAESPAADTGAHAFGRTQRYEDGVEVTVSAPVRFTPSAAAAGHTPGNTAVTVEITVRNGTETPLRLDLAQVYGRGGDGREAARVFDVEPHENLGLSGSVLPGRQAVAAYGFDLPAAAQPVLDVEVRVDVERDAAFWSGPVP
ncbi:hypothetical protein [Streptomyces sp. NPDC003327]